MTDRGSHDSLSGDAFPTVSSVSNVKPIERVDVSEAAYRRIRKMIMVGQLPPDGKIDLEVLAELLNVGRSTVANALKRLNLEDLVYIVPRQGTFVKAFSVGELEELYDVRMCLEVWATRDGVANVTDEAAAEIRELLDAFVPLLDSPEEIDPAEFAIKNRDFHTFLVSLAKNKKVLEIYERLNIDVLGHRIYNIRGFLRSKGETRIEEALRPRRVEHTEHEAIATAYLSGDPVSAADAIRAHLANSLRNHFRVVTLWGVS